MSTTSYTKTAPSCVPRAGRRAFLLCSAMLACVLGGTLSSVSSERSGRAPVALPAAARGAVARTLGSDDPRLAIHRTGGAITAINRLAGIDAMFTGRGGVVRVDRVSWALGLRAIGRGRRLAAVAAVSPVAAGNRVRYDRPGLAEWYVNTGVGLEQGFTLATPPSGAGSAPVTLALGALPPGLDASVSRDRHSVTVTRSGATVLRYSGLVVSDASGRVLPAWIEASGRHLSLRLDDRGARYPLRIDPFVQVGKLTASDGTTSDWLGLSVAISGNMIVAGAPRVNVGGNHPLQGAVYVFVEPAGGWASATETAKLTASDGVGGDQLGSTVAISGDTIVAGAPDATVGNDPINGGNRDQGAVYVFVKPAAGGWQSGTETAKLVASDGSANDLLGTSLGISGDAVVTGAFNQTIGANQSEGAAYVFVKPAGGWGTAPATQAKLTASDGTAGDDLAHSVAISGDTVVASRIGTPANGRIAGAEYVFIKPSGGWAEEHEAAKLTPPAGGRISGGGNGQAVAVSGDTAVAGGANVVYVFVKPASGWSDGQPAATLTASAGSGGDELGFALAVSGNTVTASAPFANNSLGAVYVFAKPAGGWTDGHETQKLSPTQDTPSAGEFGYSVGIDGGSIVAGAPFEQEGNTGQQGATYVFTGSSGATSPTSTSVSCSPSSIAVGESTACTATVSDTIGESDSTGSVTFSSDSSGSFGFGDTCTLAGTGTPGVASCTVSYTPSAADSGTHTIAVRYGGDGSHDPSGGTARLTVIAPVGGGNGGGGGGGGGGGNGGGGAGQVTARFVLKGQSQNLPHHLLLSAGSSTSTSGPIVNYTWTTGGGGQGGVQPLVTPCGTSRLASLTFRRSGPQMVSLSVRSALGQVSTVTQPINVPATDVNAAPQPAFDCENPSAGNQATHGLCVKTFGWGIVQVNSRGTNDCFDLQQRQQRLANLGAHDAAAPPAARKVVWLTHATVHGPVAIDGLYLPLLESVQSDFDDGDSTIQIGKPIPILVGQYHLASIGLNAKIGAPDPHTHLVPLVPNVGLTGNGQSIGALPIAGNVDVNLSSFRTADGFNISKVKLHVKLPSPFSVPVDGYLETDNETGVHITGFQVGPFDTDIVPGFTLKKAFFKYVGGTDEVWQGGADIYLPGQVAGAGGSALPASVSPVPGLNFSPPPPDLGIGFKHGQLDHFGIGVNFVPPFQPVLFPGVNLSNAHFGFGFRPFQFTGGIGIAIPPLFGVDGDVFVAFASPSTPYGFPNDVATGDLSPLAGRWLDSFTIAVGGDAHLTVPVAGDIPLLNAWLIYEAPDYFEVGSHFDFKATVIELKGDAGGWILPSQGKFSFGGDLSLCLNVTVLGFHLNPCLGNGIVISSRGIGGCATVLVPTPIPLAPAVPVTIAAGYTWDGDLKVVPFSCDLGDFTEANPRAARDHAAGDGSGVRAADAAWSFDLTGGLPSAEVRVTGRGGAPDVTLSGPGGRTYSTANPPTDPRHVLMFRYGDTTLVSINHPTGGHWSVSESPGSAPLDTVAYAKGLAPANVKARVAGRGSIRTLTYQAVPARGRTITFVERGARTYRILAVARGSHGRIRFRLDDGRAGRRQIVAVIAQDGIQTQSVVVARYSAPGPHRPPRPARLRVRHRGYTLNVSWRPAAGTASYEVLIKSSDGGRTMQIVRGHRATLVGVEPGLHGRVLVDAVAADGSRSADARQAFAAVRSSNPTPIRHRHRPAA